MAACDHSSIEFSGNFVVLGRLRKEGTEKPGTRKLSFFWLWWDLLLTWVMSGDFHTCATPMAEVFSIFRFLYFTYIGLNIFGRNSFFCKF